MQFIELTPQERINVMLCTILNHNILATFLKGQLLRLFFQMALTRHGWNKSIFPYLCYYVTIKKMILPVGDLFTKKYFFAILAILGNCKGRG